MILDARVDAEFHIRQRTHGQRYAPTCQTLDQGGVFLAAHAVIDARHLEQVERFVNIFRRAFLTRMRDGEESLCARALEYGLEFRRRMAALGRIEADSGDRVLVRQRLFERAHRIVGAQVAQKTQDQPVRDAEFLFAIGECTADAAEHGRKGDTTLGVRLRIEEDFHMHHPVRVRAAQIRHSQGMEVCFIAQHVGAGVVQVEKRLQIGKVVRRAQGRDRWIFQGHAVLVRELERELRFKRTLDVQMQLGLGQGADKCFGHVGVHGIPSGNACADSKCFVHSETTNR